MSTETLEKDNTDLGKEVAPDILCLPLLIVNVCLIGKPDAGDHGWVLVDGGISNFTDRIMKAAESRFGKNARPKAIILTHGHFDHVGALTELCKTWDVDIYAHELEIPYLIGELDYPPADPSVGGGLMSEISPLYPHHGINLGTRVKPLPLDGSIPFLPDWRYICTPGHTPGHISLFRDSDRILIAGDAITTVKQESAAAVLTQHKDVNGPPSYFTTDWQEAWNSVKKIAELNPSLVVSGHGTPLSGEVLSSNLQELARDFDKLAIPEHGKYVKPKDHRKS